MVVARMKEDYNAITFELFRRMGINMKFKVRLYNKDSNNNSYFYHNEYVYNYGRERNASIALTPSSFIQINYGRDDKNVFYMFEVIKNRFVSKVSKLVTILEAYDNGDIDIIKIDQSGTHINSQCPSVEKITVGKCKMKCEIIIRPNVGDVGVNIYFEKDQFVELSLADFLDFYYKLKNLDYSMMTLSLINYLGHPQLGVHEKDFRETQFLDTNYNRVPEGTVAYNSMGSLNNIQIPRKLDNKPKW